MTGRTAAYGRAAFVWAVKRGLLQSIRGFADRQEHRQARARALVMTKSAKFGARRGTPHRPMA
jgi:hypothetical protein